MDFDSCTDLINHRTIRVSENKRTFSIRNTRQRQIGKVKVDGCLITNSSTQKCDYLFEIKGQNKEVFYVELKGKDIERALSQIKNTIRLCEDRHNGINKKSFIVSSRVPTGTDIQKQLKSFYQTTGFPVQIKNKFLEVKI